MKKRTKKLLVFAGPGAGVRSTPIIGNLGGAKNAFHFDDAPLTAMRNNILIRVNNVEAGTDLKKFALLATVFAFPLLSGCASIVDGTNQTLSVETVSSNGDVPGASCELDNSKGTWFVQTPGSVVVHRAYGDMSLKCTKDGYAPTVQIAKSTTKAMAAGNVLFGGLVGVGVDMSTGAAYDYPSLIKVIMTPSARPVASLLQPSIVASSD